MEYRLVDLKPGETGKIKGISGSINNKRRLTAMGIVQGKEITVEMIAPMGDPRIYSVLGYRLSMRNEDAQTISVVRT
ncbi:MAG: ferrous iron transport protein A [Magnetococcales bacterium]|nr:ferrous iron transport protein A [Magnetococcales bacterium]MBF0150600.1 ferrous iron transport protein A [Magnetococcales bacterium]MBF0174279.1 ferrous iron transport protein A [Magnetococcales bacterium]MBF0348257.1 ferrous iron transport protein A [Magnetococcales bacterium]MBF0629382.1 ferrous iron transport protein A [Magnetococcales bacterium]